jgi:hypothetical protein
MSFLVARAGLQSPIHRHLPSPRSRKRSHPGGLHPCAHRRRATDLLGTDRVSLRCGSLSAGSDF